MAAENGAAVLARLRGILMTVLEADGGQIGVDEAFHERLELDSLQKIELIAQVERGFGTRFEPEEAAYVNSLTDLLTALDHRGLIAEATHEAPGAPTSPIDLLVARHLAAGNGDRVSLIDRTGRELTYADLHREARTYAATLAGLGVRTGCRALVVADDSIEAVVAVLGLWWRGCVPVMVSPMLRDAEIAFMAKDSSAEYVHLLVPGDRAAALGAALGPITRRTEGADLAAPTEPAEPGDPALFAPNAEALVQYTSGSSGQPRGVRHSMAGIEAVLTGFGSRLALTGQDRVLSTAKLSFGYGFGNSLLFPLAAGATAVLLSGPTDPFAIVAALHRHRPTVLCAVPRVYAGLLDQVTIRGAQVDFSSVRLGTAAGEHLPADLSRRAADAFPFPLVNGLGATEVLHIVIAISASAPMHGSTGHPVPGVQATIRDDAGQPVPAGVHGRLHIAGPCVALGYIDRPEATARTFADGGAYTGDIAYRTADGDFRHVCRADDLLNLGGFKVAPAEIELVLRGIEDVADCAVVAGKGPSGLELAVAYLVPREGVDPQVLRKDVNRTFREMLPPYKRPSRIEVVPALPTTSTGKLARFQLREATAAQQ